MARTARLTPLPPGPFAGLVVVVALAHGAALWEMGRSSWRIGQGEAAGARVMHVRQIPAAGQQDVTLNGSEAPAAPAGPSFAVLDRLAQRRSEQQQPAGGAASKEPEADAFAEYLPRNKLTAAPQPLALVDVPFPPDVLGIVDLKVRIALFVDENGTVRRIRFDSPDVPSPFALAVLDTFSNVRFKPGEVDGVAVRSQIRLEVEFNANNRPR